MTVRPSVCTSVHTDSAGGGGESQDNLTGEGVENAIFSWREITSGAFGQPAFFLARNCMTIVAFEKEVSLKAYKLL